jgi:hypothetical protein
MNLRNALTLGICGTAIILGTGYADGLELFGGPVKFTGGGEAVGTVKYRVEDGFDNAYNVSATAAGQAQLTEPVDYVVSFPAEDYTGTVYAGKGNFQFVDHVTGMCFHADLEFGGAKPLFVPNPPGDTKWVDASGEKIAYARGQVGDCGSGDGLFNDGYIDLWLYDSGEKGRNKDAWVYVDRYDIDGVFIYSYDGVLESGNYTLHKVKTK